MSKGGGQSIAPIQTRIPAHPKNYILLLFESIITFWLIRTKKWNLQNFQFELNRKTFKMENLWVNFRVGGKTGTLVGQSINRKKNSKHPKSCTEKLFFPQKIERLNDTAFLTHRAKLLEAFLTDKNEPFRSVPDRQKCPITSIPGRQKWPFTSIPDRQKWASYKPS